jgi:hypothetical protein
MLLCELWSWATIAPNAISEIRDDCSVQQKNGASRQHRSMPQLICLNRQQRTRDDNGDPLTPALQRPQANTLRQEQCSVDERSNAPLAEMLWRGIPLQASSPRITRSVTALRWSNYFQHL